MTLGRDDFTPGLNRGGGGGHADGGRHPTGRKRGKSCRLIARKISDAPGHAQ